MNDNDNENDMNTKYNNIVNYIRQKSTISIYISNWRHNDCAIVYYFTYYTIGLIYILYALDWFEKITPNLVSIIM